MKQTHKVNKETWYSVSEPAMKYDTNTTYSGGFTNFDAQMWCIKHESNGLFFRPLPDSPLYKEDKCWWFEREEDAQAFKTHQTYYVLSQQHTKLPSELSNKSNKEK